MTDPRRPAAPTDHAAHDLLLVAEAADRGGRLPASQADCPDCLALHADLVSLARALPTAATPARPRDFTLTPVDAARLRPAGWRRFLAAIGSSRDVVTRPLAIGLTTLGLAGLLVATVPGALPGAGSTAAGPAAEDLGSSAGSGYATVTAGPASAAPAPAIGAPAGAAPAPSAAAASGDVRLEIASEAPKTQADGVFSGEDDAPAGATAPDIARQNATAPAAGAVAPADATGVSVLFVVAGTMLLVGLGLFGLRWSARRG